ISVPSTNHFTWVTATLSDAVAVRATMPLTVEPARGLVTLTMGASLSGRAAETGRTRTRQAVERTMIRKSEGVRRAEGHPTTLMTEPAGGPGPHLGSLEPDRGAMARRGR